jgi:hypothetical protein
MYMYIYIYIYIYIYDKSTADGIFPPFCKKKAIFKNFFLFQFFFRKSFIRNFS